MFSSWNWNLSKFWTNPANNPFKPFNLKELIISPQLILSLDSSEGKKFHKLIQKQDSISELEIVAEDSSNWGLDFLGRMMIRTGYVLLIPEGSEVVIPWSLADEVVGVALIVGGLLLVTIF